jgi:hypothetical protein
MLTILNCLRIGADEAFCSIADEQASTAGRSLL